MSAASTIPDSPIADERLARALASLDGLSVGDAFGQRFFIDEQIVRRRLRDRELPEGTWWWTDDTAMALSVVRVLRLFGSIDPDELAASFRTGYQSDPGRGYGGGMKSVLSLEVPQHTNWRQYVLALFEGAGSMGNGAAMRVAPLGAYFADDLRAAIREARTSAEVTHTHPDGIAGAIAVAVAAALAWSFRESPLPPAEFLRTIERYTPPGEVAGGIAMAAALPAGSPLREAAALLGNGTRAIAADTVPFCCWMAAWHLAANQPPDFATAMFETISVGGDRDTNCAIVGGILAASGSGCVPAEWLARREPLPH